MTGYGTPLERQSGVWNFLRPSVVTTCLASRDLPEIESSFGPVAVVFLGLSAARGASLSRGDLETVSRAALARNARDMAARRGPFLMARRAARSCLVSSPRTRG